MPAALMIVTLFSIIGPSEFPELDHSRHQKDVVVQSQANQDRERHHGDDPIDAARVQDGWGEHSEIFLAWTGLVDDCLEQ